MAKPFDDSDRAAIYRAIHQRRDMRHFVSGAVDEGVLKRLLDAAHHALSVGYPHRRPCASRGAARRG